MTTQTVTITNNATGESIQCPLRIGAFGHAVIDVQGIGSKLNLFTFDPAFSSTASCESSITYIDGDQGILLYRGYTIEQLAANSTYLEVCYLLLYGELPTPGQMETYRARITRHTMLNEGLLRFFNGFRHDAHPMAMLVGVVGALSSYYHDSMDINDPAHREMCAIRLVAKLPTIAAASYRYLRGQPYMYPINKLGYVENLLHMMFSMPTEAYHSDETNQVAVRALEMMLILHADHEQNASTSTVRGAGSSQANPFACVAAGIATLWGPAHGGANEAVIRMLEEIGEPKNIPAYLERVKDKNSGTRLMGFGHRIYKNYDPRAKLIRDICHQLLKQLHMERSPHQAMFETAMELERIALEDDYFIERKLYPNVDFYSGIILRAIGIPLNMFTVMFAVARTVGWVSQWMEMMNEPNRRICRPRQLYIGPGPRDFVPMSERA